MEFLCVRCARHRKTCCQLCEVHVTLGDVRRIAAHTGLHDFNPFTVNTNVTSLADEEAAWHRARIAEGAAAGRKTVLLSHHQLFSAYEPIGRDTAGSVNAGGTSCASPTQTSLGRPRRAGSGWPRSPMPRRGSGRWIRGGRRKWPKRCIVEPQIFLGDSHHGR